MSSTDGSFTKIGWNRRSSAASFSMCFRYSSSVVAPMQRSSPRASAGFSRFAASIAPSAAPAPTSVWSSSMKQMISPPASRDLLEHGLQAVLELAAVLGAGDERAEVERDEALVLQPLGHVAGDDALGEALDDGGLADAGLADQDGVVLRAPREDLDDAADLLVAADHRIELALPRELRQVAAVPLERLVLGLGVLIGDALGAAHVDQRTVEAVLRDAGLPQDAARGAVGLVGDRDEQVLGRAVVVLEPLHLIPGRVEDGLEPGAHVLPARAADLREAANLGLDVPPDRVRTGAELRQQGADDAVLLLDEREQEVLGLELLVAFTVRQRLRGLDRLLRLDGELVEAKRCHGASAASWAIRARTDDTPRGLSRDPS